MDKLQVFKNRLAKLNINVELVGNYPWVYIHRINGVLITERFIANHGFTIAFLPVRVGKEKVYGHNRNIPFNKKIYLK